MKIEPGKTKTIDPKKAATSAATAAANDEQKRLLAMIDRRHPEYDSHVDHWDFLEGTYEGGRDWFAANVFRYIKEGDGEYKDRVARGYRFNHTREVVDLLNKYLFKQHITRNVDDAPEPVKAFWKKATKNGLSIRDFSRQVSKRASIYGRVGVVVDNTAGGKTPVSKADEKKANVRTYAYIVGPEQLLDYSYDDEGNLNWILIQECVRDDKDPLTSTGAERPRFRLWTKTDWKLYEVETKNRKRTVVKVDEGNHGLGEVPVILADNFISDDEYISQSLIDDIAYLDRAVANYLSNLDAIIQDQTFSQMAMPAQNVLPGQDAYNQLLDMSTKRVFLYDGEGDGKPFYLSPDPKQAQMILAVINKIINEIYHTVGLAGERTKQDNALGIDNSSGVAKAYDFERVNALLQAKADSLEVIENKVARLVALWNGIAPEKADALVSYPDNFDTRGLYDEFDISARLSLVEAPDSVRQEQMKALIDKLFPQLATDIKERMLADLKAWPIDPVQMAADMAKATASAAPAKPADDKAALTKQKNSGLAKATMEAK